MKITTIGIAKGCVAILMLHIVLGIAVCSYFDFGNYGLLAALFAANAGAAFFAGYIFNLPAFSRSTLRGVSYFTFSIAAVSGLMSAYSWMADEMEDAWLPIITLIPIIVLLFMLVWFVNKYTKEETKHEDE